MGLVTSVDGFQSCLAFMCRTRAWDYFSKKWVCMPIRNDKVI